MLSRISLVIIAIISLAAISCTPVGYPTPYAKQYPAHSRSAGQMARDLNLKSDIVSRSARCRRNAQPMRPTSITIHSTQNPTAGARQHALALKRSSLKTSWHFTVDEGIALQHMPICEQAIHADVRGPGNRTSIGIEMCEHRGNNRARTIERTAMLTAVLMKSNRIPLSRVVPHYHWPRRGMRPPHKNCPHFLLDNGKPGRKWRWYLGRVQFYHRQLK